ncbi:MAG: hypothetical protein JXB05_25190 [Myxococcaceae bacterium]|nr:hypothetical protein [Myxococcaceae bacterium]
MASVEGVNCLAERGGVTARISAEPENGGAPIRSGEFQVPGPWLLQLGDLCEGGSYRITGELLPDNRGLEAEALKVGGRAASSGGPQQVVVAVPVTVPPAVVRLKPLEDARLTARCGEVAQGALEQRIPEPCSNLPLSWDYLRGPRLSQDFFMGQRIELATQEMDFGALIGESVVLRVSSSTGQVIPHEQPVLITADPFIEVHRRTEKATGTEANLLGVFVELRNTTECGVSQVDHVELLEGVDYVPGSARFNGAPVELEVEGGRLVVRGLALEGDTTGVLTYVVRPRLLEAARFDGQSSLRGVAISQPVAMPPPGGCGCAGGGSGFAALGFAGLAAVLRRRRAR